MADTLKKPNGAVVLGSVSDPLDLFEVPTPIEVRNGETARSEVYEVPCGTDYVSFEVRATPTGPCALAVVIRQANRSTRQAGEVLSAGGNVSSNTVFDSFLDAQSQVFAIDGDSNFVQIDVTPTGADCQVTVIGAAR